MNKTTKLATLIVALLLCVLPAAAKKTVTTKTLTFGKDIATLNVSTGLEVDYEQGPDPVIVTISGPSDKLKHIKCTADKTELHISVNGNVRADLSDIEIDVKGGYIYTMNCSSGANLKIDGLTSNDHTYTLNAASAGTISANSAYCKNIVLECASAGDINVLNMDCKNVVANATSAGDIKLTGSAVNVVFKASSGADISAQYLKAKNGEAQAATGAEIDCCIINAKISTSTGGEVDNHAN